VTRRFLAKFKGSGDSAPPRPSFTIMALAGLGAALAIGILALLTDRLPALLLLGSFGSSCAMLFGFPELPFSQPRNLVGGHVVSSLVGLVFLWAFGPAWWSLGLAVGAAVFLMMVARVIHPPAASNPVIIFLAHAGWSFLWFPTLAGALLLVAVGMIYNNALCKGSYPRYW
jgi:CBS-domain-containing membrane protein